MVRLMGIEHEEPSCCQVYGDQTHSRKFNRLILERLEYIEAIDSIEGRFKRFGGNNDNKWGLYDMYLRTCFSIKGVRRNKMAMQIYMRIISK